MLFSFFYYVMCLVHILVFKELYWPPIKEHVDAAFALHEMLQSWTTVIMAHIALRVIAFKQWLHKTTTHLDNNRILITHVIRGKPVSFIIRPATKKPVAVVDEDYDNCFLEESLQFLRFEVEPFGPSTFGIKKALNVHWDSEPDCVTRIEPSQ